jgi:hypothetical protein
MGTVFRLAQFTVGLTPTDGFVPLFLQDFCSVEEFLDDFL